MGKENLYKISHGLIKPKRNVVRGITKHKILIICLCLFLGLLNFLVEFKCLDQEFFALFFAFVFDYVIDQLFLLDADF